MNLQLMIPRLALTLILTLVLSFSFDTAAQHVNYEYGVNPDRIVIRQTIPDPQAVRRAPLTSDRLSTTSTRLVDARRGFRPYSSVYCDRVSHRRYAAYDDHFGISRPENRPWSYSQRKPRTGVTTLRNETRQATRTAVSRAQPSAEYILILREQPRETQPKPDMKIRIHKDRTATPTTSGAVLITADGTVIQIGD